MNVAAAEPTITTALRLMATGAWRSLTQLGARANPCGDDTSDALLTALCASPLEPARRALRLDHGLNYQENKYPKKITSE